MIHPTEQHLAAVHRLAFAREFNATEGRWSPHNIARWARSTGERPQRLVRLKLALCTLACVPADDWPPPLGLFDHGELWHRAGRPWSLAAHPYSISTGELALLHTTAASFPGLAVFVDDRPSYYGHGSIHVRLEVPDPRRPWRAPRSTSRTRLEAL